jgi:RHH-type proline utilization regulon transcriptional repressor/proline dehydrogenase/delta 1-pyrroline-5-carboxylate dehydrogenase
MVGAVVGVQPFGGVGLSGTGPKAGGPLVLFRLLARRPGDAPARALALPSRPDPDGALETLRKWALRESLPRLAAACLMLGVQSPAGATLGLPGPTGERNEYRTVPRARVLCLAADENDRLVQLAAACAVGARAAWPAGACALLERLPRLLQAQVDQIDDWTAGGAQVDVVLHHGEPADLRAVCQQVAQWPGAIVAVIGLAPGAADVPLERLVIERSTSVNTAAAGGNASLMTIG